MVNYNRGNMKKLIILSLILGACASTPKTVTTTVEIPVSTHASHVAIPDCPALPINSLAEDASWDQRLHAWDASLVILKGCVEVRQNLLNEINK